MPSHLHGCRMPARLVALPLAATLLLTGCAGRGSAEDDAVGDTATTFLAAAASAPQSGCDLLAPATLDQLRSDDEDCGDAVSAAAPKGDIASTPPTIQVYGRDAMVRWADQTLFLARFDDGWRVTAAGCKPRGEDLPYDCTIEGR
ncbi:hypothetical protein GCM10022415_08520 [Knoellia locipacati]|uniref:Lipoprotein n=1 Tax=Knoellia locipacati TaxID=882824 RepID=A0A512SXY4_9MICO|nr:hypothetical protein [Knoellia locipacati]GEQ12803.1 hypothetical protein KLO01_08500 [Knoellia locipacati]